MEKDRYGGSTEKLGVVGKVYLLYNELMEEKDKKKAKKIFEQIRKIYFDEFKSDIVDKISEDQINQFKKEYGDDFFIKNKNEDER